MEVETGDVLLCTVDKIVGTTVFVNIENFEIPGTIILSEIAAGRIRNLRDYVVPKKVIVCKVLRVHKDHLELSLRRVSQKEKKEILERHKSEKSFENLLKSVLNGKENEVIGKIKKDGSISEFLESSKKDPSKLAKLIGKSESDKVLEILSKQKKKKISLKKEIKFSSKKPDGLNKIKEILGKFKDVEVRYIAAGRYSIKSENETIKRADQRLKEVLEFVEKEAKKEKIEFQS